MAACLTCSGEFEQGRPNRLYCSPSCRGAAGRRAWRAHHKPPLTKIKCMNCQVAFMPKRAGVIYCSKRCGTRVATIQANCRRMVKRATEGTLDLNQVRTQRGPYTSDEISALRADPLCVLPNRSLRAQWMKCRQLGIPRDQSLNEPLKRSPESIDQQKAERRSRPNRWRRGNFRRNVRRNPGPILDQLRKLARGHPYAEDLILEGFATVLRLAIPPVEAFKLAKVEVNRTLAQPFRERPFNPDIDYAARETGRQVARASDIRAARGET